MKRKLLPWISTTSSTASRVVPGIGETMAREVPVSRFSSVDLPTFGCPIIATLTSLGSGAISASGATCVSPVWFSDFKFSGLRLGGFGVQRFKLQSFKDRFENVVHAA